MTATKDKIYKYKFRVMKRMKALVFSLNESGLDTIVGSVVEEISRDSSIVRRSA